MACAISSSLSEISSSIPSSIPPPEPEPEPPPEPEPEPPPEPPPVLSPPPVSAPFTISVLEICSFEIPFTFFTCAVTVTEEDGSPSSTYSHTPDFVLVIVVSFEILSLSFHVTLL